MTSTERPTGISALIAIDRRGLAFLRIALALLILIDLAGRLPDLGAHYTDYGIFSRTDVMQLFAQMHDIALCVHFMFGALHGQILLFAFHAICALALLVGYRTWAATWLCWFFTASLQLRNPLVLAGNESLLRLLLFWCIFLPLGHFYSFDNLRRTEARPSEKSYVASVGSAALLLQLVTVPWAGVAWKWLSQEWRDGLAMRFLTDDFYIATTLGHWLNESRSLSDLLSVATLAIEAGGPILLIVSAWLPSVRIGAILALAGLYLTTSCVLATGMFPLVMTAGLAAWLPAKVWDRIAESSVRHRIESRVTNQAAWRAVVDWLRARPFVEPIGWVRRVAPAVCAVLAGLTLYWNVGSFNNSSFSVPAPFYWWLDGFVLQQRWDLFAYPTTNTGWVAVRGQLVSGQEIELLTRGGRVPSLADFADGYGETGQRGLRRYANFRWRMLLRSVGNRNPSEKTGEHYARFLCREWNAVYSESERLSVIEISAFRARAGGSNEAPSTTIDSVWTHDCLQ